MIMRQTTKKASNGEETKCKCKMGTDRLPSLCFGDHHQMSVLVGVNS